MSKILFRLACGLFLFAAPIALTGCDESKPAPAPAASGGPAAPGTPAEAPGAAPAKPAGK